MLRTDTGNFDKFLTSLGLLMIGAALVIPYFYFRNTGTLELSDHELQGMTMTGRSALLDRQEAIVSLEPWVAVGSALLAAVGLFLLVAGAIRLREAQAKEDEEADLRRTRARLEVEEMSPAEQEAKATAQAEEEAEEESRARPPVRPGGGHTLYSDRRLRASALSRVSTRIAQVFATWRFSGYTFKSQLRIGTATEEIRLDGVFENEHGASDVVLKIRLSSDPALLRRNVKNIAGDLFDTIGRYSMLTGRSASGWLVVVIPDEAAPELPTDARGWDLETLDAAVRPFGRFSLLSERELKALPRKFSDLFPA